MLTDLIKNKIDSIPEEPGIYKFSNKKGDIIYIGKSKCLKKRVKSYFVPSPAWDKAKKMVRFIHDIDYIVTDTHLEAMLLECELIKTIKPYFNVIMKNDERYVYLKLNNKGTIPLSIVYEKENNCYGPFRSKSRLQDFLDSFRNIYPIVLEKRTLLFEYHIFPITMDEDSFSKNSLALKKLLDSEKYFDKFTKTVEKKMKSAAHVYKYESASIYKNLLENLCYIKSYINYFNSWINRTILLDLELKKGHKLFLFANGQLVDKIYLERVSSEKKKDFIKSAQTKIMEINKVSKSMVQNSKGNIDFQSIIYSELMTYPIESIEILDTFD